MKNKSIHLVASALIATSAFAHDDASPKLEVTSIDQVGHYYKITVNDTHQDQEILCAVYDENNKPLMSDTQYADPMVTTVILSYQGSSKVESAKCVIKK